MYYADGCVFEYRGNFCAAFHKGAGCTEYIITEHMLSHECPDCAVNIVVGETDDVLETMKVHELEGMGVYEVEDMERQEREDIGMFGEVADIGIHELDGTWALGPESTAITYSYPPNMRALDGMMSLINLIDEELIALDASSTIQDLEPPYTPDSMMTTEDTDSNPFSDSDVWSVVEGGIDSDSVHSYASSDSDEVFPEEPLCPPKATLRPLTCPNSGEIDRLELGLSYGWPSFADGSVGSASDNHSMDCSVAGSSTGSSVNAPSSDISLEVHGGPGGAVSLVTKVSIVEEEDEEDEDEEGGVPL